MSKKKKPIGRKMLNANKVPGISDAVLDKVLIQIVEHGKGLREIAFELDVSYATLIRRLNQDPEVKALIEEAREMAIFDIGTKLVEIADATTSKTLEVNKLRISARKDAVSMVNRNKEAVARSRPVKEAAANNITVGVVIMPAKNQVAGPSQPPRLVVDNGRTIEHVK